MSESPNSIRSKAYARIVDLISEGPIVWLTNGLKSVYLDGTPIQNEDGTFNFPDTTVVLRDGSSDQDYIEGFSDVENTVSVGVEVKNSAPVVRSITNTNIDAIDVVIGVPALYLQDDTGNMVATSVQVKVEIQDNGGPWQTVSTNEGATVSLTRIAPSYFNAGYLSAPGDLISTGADVQGSAPNNPVSFADFSVKRKPLYRNRTGQPQTTVLRLDRADYNYGFPTWAAVKTITIGGRDDQEQTTSFRDVPASSGQYLWRLVKVSGVGEDLNSTITPAIPGAYSDFEMSATTKLNSSAILISGKTNSRYQRSVRIPLTGNGPWNVRMSRITQDDSLVKIQRKTFWDSYTEIIDSKLRYPFSAIAAISVDAEQFSSIPSRGYEIFGKKIQVPTNYDANTRTYSGSWDGTFKTAWSNNPAWCFYDLLTNPRYGLGEFITPDRVDKWALYAIGRYCDELVPDGFGGLEHRFTCNIYLQSRQEAFKAIGNFASIFRGMAFWGNGTITAVQDSPASPAYLYTPANVIDGMFTYSGASAKASHSVALVTWNDPSDQYKQKVEYVEDRDSIARFGVVTTDVIAVGCTTQGQANRVGRWLLYSERAESEVVSFKTGLDGAICRPGQIIKVADPARAGVRFGGRLLAATTTTATVDSAVTLASGQVYTIACLKSDGTVMESTITNAPATTASLAFSPALPEAPAVGSMWILSCPSVQAQLFRVVSVVENDRHEFEVNALAHDDQKYNAIEQGLTITPRSISTLNYIPDAVTGVVVSEVLYLNANIVSTRMDVSWVASQGAGSYGVSLQRAGGAYGPELVTSSPSIEINDVQEGPYNVKVVAIGPLGARSQEVVTAYVVQGKTLPPSNVTGFTVTRYKESLSFSWIEITDVDRDHYEIRRGDTWETGVLVGTSNGASLPPVQSPRGGTFLIKAFDTSGNPSSTAAQVIATDYSKINAMVTVDDGAGGFGGVKTNTIEITSASGTSWADALTWGDSDRWDYLSYRNGVTLSGTGTWNDMTLPWCAYRGAWLFEGPSAYSNYATWSAMTTPWASDTATWMSASPVPSGTYVSDVVDIGYVASSVVSIDPTIDILSAITNTWATFTQPWAYYSSPDWTWYGLTRGVSVQYEISTSTDGITWSSWFRFGLGTYQFRYLKVRVTLATGDNSYRPYLTGLVINVDVPDRVEHFGNVSVGTGGATITFSPAFVAVNTVQVTLQSATVGDRYTVTGKSNTAVTVNVYDSVGSPKAGTVDVDVFGYGERQ